MATGTNGIDPKILAQFKGDLGRLEAEIDVFKAEHMARCKRQRELINSTYDRARDAGIPVKALKVEIKAQKLEKRADALRDGLEDEDAESLDLIIAALGGLADTPLGQAAMSKGQQAAADREAAIDSLTSADEEFEQADPAKQQVADNVTKLQKGLKKTKA